MGSLGAIWAEGQKHWPGVVMEGQGKTWRRLEDITMDEERQESSPSMDSTRPQPCHSHLAD